MDKTYIRVGGRWTYLYRAVDKQGLAVDFLLSEHKDISAARQFFIKAVKRYGAPERITLDGYPATHAAAAELKRSGVLRPQTKVRTSKNLNNLVEQDHRRIKQHIYPMLGFKSFRNAAVTISGVELVQKIRKGQFNIAELTSGVKAREPQVWSQGVSPVVSFIH